MVADADFTPSRPRWPANFYVQLGAAFAVAAAVLAARVVLYPENARTYLSPVFAWWAPAASWWAVPAVLVLGAAVLLAARTRERARPWLLLPLAFGAGLAVNLAPRGWRGLPFGLFNIFRDDARWLFKNADVFHRYTALTAHFNQHCRVRPGGTYWLLGLADRAFGGSAVLTEVAFIFLGAGAALAVYAAARPLVGKKDACGAAALFALAPSVLVFGACPDGLYALLLIATFALAVRAFWSARGWPYALAAGVAGAAAAVTTYNILPLQLFVAAAALAASLSGPRKLAPWVNFGLMLVTAAALLAAFQLATGYDHWAAFRRAYWAAQTYPSGGDNIFKMAARLLGRGGQNLPKAGERPYGVWVFANLYSFFFMMGVPAAVLYGREMWGIIRDRGRRRTPLGAFALTFLGAFLAFNFSGLLLGEAERVWLFLLPGFAVPAAVQLGRLAGPGGKRLAVATFAILAAQGLLFHLLLATPF